AHKLEDPLPAAFRRRWNLPPLHAAIQQIHYPDEEAELRIARRRIAFDDLFLLQLGLLKQKQEWQRMRAVPLPLSAERLAGYVARLPFALTEAQRRALSEVLADIGWEVPMGRLLQGDVGSGKTVVAALAALAAVEHGCQAAIVAPTEILAEQHARTLSALFAEMLPMLKPVLITGSLSARARAEAWKQVGSGQAAVVVGTHALFSERGEFARLALVVIDEQHRFGVYQRDTLWRKGERPHLLAMTATPIPRTLALQKFGDLDLSVIDALPVGRQPIRTRYAAPDKRQEVYKFLRKQVSDGRQAYVICPLVDESDAVAAKAVTSEFRHLRDEVFPDLTLGLLHGRLRPDAKDEAMRRFRDGETQVLVATTVIEVGVDVPNASVMLVEGAERFGLAQLHQLRGRVGRGVHQSYCVLMASESVDEAGEERLRLVESTCDGFALAEADLRLRRTGAFFGSEQSGDEGLLRWVAFADPQEARQAAEAILAEDPNLTRPEHALLAARVAALLERQRAGAGAAAVEDGETASLAYV
ncbi:MAG TPA: ATP-dependent DNA helicase RecG, partial [Chloroflexota bacterium]|nr:ATP-dependent DNA helicase RecG [Chloroflexota bacterium]